MDQRREPDSRIATRRGDDGSTGLLFGGQRVPKDDPRTEAYGDVDEAVAALGLARAELALKAQYGALPRNLARFAELILRLQRELFVVGAELATAPGAEGKAVDGQTRVIATMVEGLDSLLAEFEAAVAIPTEFVVPGETRLSAAIELARTVVRRAERRAVSLRRAQPVADDRLVPYLNRLGDLLWVLARAAEQAEGHSPTPSRGEAAQRGS
jgi:cob(I)alamin adenosyltransferase